MVRTISPPWRKQDRRGSLFVPARTGGRVHAVLTVKDVPDGYGELDVRLCGLKPERKCPPGTSTPSSDISRNPTWPAVGIHCVSPRGRRRLSRTTPGSRSCPGQPQQKEPGLGAHFQTPIAWGEHTLNPGSTKNIHCRGVGQTTRGEPGTAPVRDQGERSMESYGGVSQEVVRAISAPGDSNIDDSTSGGKELFQPSREDVRLADEALASDVREWKKTVAATASSGRPPSGPQKMLGQTPCVMQLLGADTVTGKAAATGGIYAAPPIFLMARIPISRRICFNRSRRRWLIP